MLLRIGPRIVLKARLQYVRHPTLPQNRSDALHAVVGLLLPHQQLPAHIPASLARCQRVHTVSMAPLIIAVDGPAASGKGTLAKALAEEYNFAHLDTGGLYRLLGLAAVREKVALDDEEQLAELCKHVSLSLLDDPAIRSDDAAQAASKVSALPKVRQALLHLQRDFAHSPPAGTKGAVLDGRDVGTVICPDSTAKLFVTASTEVRAKRRYDELLRRGITASYDAVLADMNERDRRDSSRATAPLKPAEDAFILDTSEMDAAHALAAAKAYVGEKLAAVSAAGGQE